LTSWDDKIESFMDLDFVGWNSYNADPITRVAVDTAKRIAGIFEGAGIPVGDVMATAMGGVEIDLLHDGKWHGSLEVDSDGEIVALTSSRGDSPGINCWDVLLDNETIKDSALRVKAFLDNEKGAAR
jgi:hypothetical protein